MIDTLRKLMDESRRESEDMSALHFRLANATVADQEQFRDEISSILDSIIDAGREEGTPESVAENDGTATAGVEQQTATPQPRS